MGVTSGSFNSIINCEPIDFLGRFSLCLVMLQMWSMCWDIEEAEKIITKTKDDSLEVFHPLPFVLLSHILSGRCPTPRIKNFYSGTRLHCPAAAVRDEFLPLLFPDKHMLWDNDVYQQGCKLQATLVGNYHRPSDWLTGWLTGVKCRATSVAKITLWHHWPKSGSPKSTRTCSPMGFLNFCHL